MQNGIKFVFKNITNRENTFYQNGIAQRQNDGYIYQK